MILYNMPTISETNPPPISRMPKTGAHAACAVQVGTKTPDNSWSMASTPHPRPNCQ